MCMYTYTNINATSEAAAEPPGASSDLASNEVSTFEAKMSCYQCNRNPRPRLEPQIAGLEKCKIS